MTTSVNLAGVSLARYAAINAALTEGFPLPDVLAIEGLSAPAWKEADAALKVELTREPAALASYAAELAAAEDWLARRVTPLEDDPNAWVAFLHAFSKSPEPFELLKTNGLGMNDISRLRRRWERRVAQENGLEKELAKLARAPGALPPIQVEPAALRRSRAAEAAQAAIHVEEPPTSSIAARRALNAHRSVLQALAADEAQAETEVRPAIVVSAPADPGPAALPPGMRGFLDMRSTQLSPEAPPITPALPFGGAAEPKAPELAAAPPQRIAASPSPEALVPEGMRHFKSLTGTEISPPPPRLTLEQYARMCVELALYPAHRLEVLRRNGVDDEQRSRLDAYWGARVREDVSVKAAWDRFYIEHWTRLRGPRGRDR